MTDGVEKTIDGEPFRQARSPGTETPGSSDLLQRVFASLLIALYSPLFLLVGLLVLVTLGRPILYKGERLGARKGRFTIYKFRTMAEGAEHLVGSDVVSESCVQARGLVSKFGKLLRNSRLDELPQLFNIVKGDMSFIGPRPERPQVYEKWCRDIPDYDQRFETKPGLVGFSQVITPHSTPKRIRCLIDNRSAQGRFSVGQHVGLVLMLFGGVAYHLGNDMYRALRNFLQTSPLFGGGEGEHRKYYRMSVSCIRVSLEGDTETPSAGYDTARLVEISHEALVIVSATPLPEDRLRFHISKRVRRAGRVDTVIKTARCRGEIVRRWPTGDKRLPHAQAILYVPASPLNSYKVHKYFLREGII